MPRLTHVSLFSGIGGIDLAAHWAGFETIQFVEREPFCQKVLAKNFPGVPIHDDVTTFDGTVFRGRVTLLSGGFPCQGISRANRHGKGLSDARSGLFYEIPRIAGQCRASWVLLENSPSIVDRGYDEVRRCLEDGGYSVTVPIVLAADDAGLPQERARAFIVARLDSLGGWEAMDGRDWHLIPDHQARHVAESKPRWHHLILRANTNTCDVVRCDGGRDGTPIIHRVAHGIPNRLDRLRALGNAVVPQQVYPILAAIAAHEGAG